MNISSGALSFGKIAHELRGFQGSRATKRLESLCQGDLVFLVSRVLQEKIVICAKLQFGRSNAKGATSAGRILRAKRICDCFDGGSQRSSRDFTANERRRVHSTRPVQSIPLQLAWRIKILATGTRATLVTARDCSCEKQARRQRGTERASAGRRRNARVRGADKVGRDRVT